MPASIKLFAGNASKDLANKIAKAYGQQLGSITIQQFKDGEISVEFNESLRGRHTFLIQSTFAPADNIMELLLAIDAAKRASAEKITVVMPYFGYARQDRKNKPRVSIAAKLHANLLSAAGANRLITCDLHAGQLQGFFDFPVDHLDSSPIFMPYIKKLALKNLVFGAPDVGSVAKVRSYANYFDKNMIICNKYRKKANTIASIQVIGAVEGADIVLIDDMIDTAGTICKAAEVLKQQGAQSVRAFCTHPLLSGDAYEKIEASALAQVVVTDTVPLKKHSNKIAVLSVADLFAIAIRNIHECKSISSLFII